LAFQGQNELVKFAQVAATIFAATLLFVSCDNSTQALSRATALHPEGRDVFEKNNCIRCHENGNGGYGKRMVDNVNLKNLDYIKTRIRVGRIMGAAEMPAFSKTTISDKELEEVAGFVRALAGWER
jgi:mono/diheme cytochrome c family protein